MPAKVWSEIGGELMDEDWYDDEEALEDVESGLCPECGAEMIDVVDKCAVCGYWLTEADRRNMWSGTSKPLWLKVTAWIVLMTFLLGVLGIAAALF